MEAELRLVRDLSLPSKRGAALQRLQKSGGRGGRNLRSASTHHPARLTQCVGNSTSRVRASDTRRLGTAILLEHCECQLSKNEGKQITQRHGHQANGEKIGLVVQRSS